MATIENALSLTNGSANLFNSINKTINNTLNNTINKTINNTINKTINNTLSNTINNTINKTISNVSKSTKNIHFELNMGMKTDGVKALCKELSGVVKSINTVVESFTKMQSVSGAAVNSANETIAKTSAQTTAAAAKSKPEGFGSKLKSFGERARGVVSEFSPIVKSGMDMADKYAFQNYQLETMADPKKETADQLRQKVYSAAQSSRTGYDGTLSTVTKLAKSSKDDFKSNNEIIYFTELMNKAFSGLGADEAAKSIEKVTDAMVNGKIKGDELKGIMEKSPMLAQALTKYTGQSQEKLAAGPGISDDVLKNAMYNSSDDINAKFQQMPATFAQIGTLINDTLTKAFGPLLQVIADAGTWIYNNWSVVEPVFWGIAGAVGAVTIAQLAMNLALLACPLTWIALAIGVVIGLIAYWIQSVGGIQIAWLIVVDSILTAWDGLKIGFFMGVYWIGELCEKMSLAIRSASVDIQNFFGDLKVRVLTKLQEMVNGAIDIINDFINLINKVTGSSIETVSHVTFGTETKLKNDAEKKAREADLEKARKLFEIKSQRHQADMDQMIAEARNNHDERVANIEAKTAAAAKNKEVNKFGASPFAGNGVTDSTNAANLAATAANTGAMKNSMDIAEDNLVYMRDIAERDAINKFTTSEISVSMGGITNNVNSELDLDGVVSYMEQKVYETMTVAAEGVYK